jgi:hemolysin-activating ACP:hemolysin acyltransferase
VNKIRLVGVIAALLVHSAAYASSAIEHPAGSQLLSRPWPAPVGHRQPRAADLIKLLSPESQDFLDQENASVDRRIQGVCRGC